MIELYPVEKERLDTMSTRLLTQEDVDKLKKNPYVASATVRNIRFTAEFKELAYDELCKGKSIREIFDEAGFDREVIGERRMINFRVGVERSAKREEGFADQRTNNSRQEAQSEEAKLAAKVRRLEHRLAYLEQENDFLKKIQEAEKAGGSKCRRK